MNVTAQNRNIRVFFPTERFRLGLRSKKEENSQSLVGGITVLSNAACIVIGLLCGSIEN